MSTEQISGIRKHGSVIYRFIKPYSLVMLFVLLLLMVDTVFELGIARVQGLFIDIIAKGSRDELFAITKIMSSLLIAFILLLAIHRYLITWVLSKVQIDLSMHLFKLLNRMPYSRVKKYLPGDLLLRIKEDTGHGADIIDAMIEFLTVSFIIVLSFLYLVKVDFMLAILAILSVPIIFISGRFFDGRIRQLSHDLESREGETRQQIHEVLKSIDIIKVFDVKQMFIYQFTKSKQQLNSINRKLEVAVNSNDNTALAVFSVAQLAALAIIAIAAARDSLSPGTIVSCSLLFELVVWPVLGLSHQWSRVQRGSGAFRRIYEWISTESRNPANEVRDEATSHMDDPVICITDMGFQLNEELPPILHNINFQLNEGEIVVVVGPSGSGKSTLCHLCVGLYKPTTGKVLVLGKNGDGWTQEDNEMVTYVSQSPTLFRDSVKGNIRLAQIQVTDDDIVVAATLARADGFIDNMTYGYDDLIHEKGSNLSGGQRQRIALSRAFIRQSRLVVLDEPTSDLDAHTQREVMESLRGILSDKSAIIVTHRMEMTELADRIVVLDKGVIVEEGTHEVLLAQQGLYSELYTTYHRD